MAINACISFTVWALGIIGCGVYYVYLTTDMEDVSATGAIQLFITILALIWTAFSAGLLLAMTAGGVLDRWSDDNQ